MPFKINNKLIKRARRLRRQVMNEMPSSRSAFIGNNIINIQLRECLTLFYSSTSWCRVMKSRVSGSEWRSDFFIAIYKFRCFFLRGKLKNWNGKLQNDLFLVLSCLRQLRNEKPRLSSSRLGENISHMTWRDRWFWGKGTGRGVSRIEFALYFWLIEKSMKTLVCENFAFLLHKWSGVVCKKWNHKRCSTGKKLQRRF